MRPDETDPRLQVQKTAFLTLSNPHHTPPCARQAPKQADAVAVIGVLFDASPRAGSTGPPGPPVGLLPGGRAGDASCASSSSFQQ